MEPPGAGGGGGDEPLAMSTTQRRQGMKVSIYFEGTKEFSTAKREVQTCLLLRVFMRQREPLDVSPTWRYPLPMPMPGQPVCATEMEANEQLERLAITPKVFFWTDAERKCPEGWGFIASVRQGVPPSGIEAELNAWADQYPKAWLAVDLRDGVVPPSTVRPLAEVLTELKRSVIVIVSRSPEHEEWPQWVLPE